MSTFTHLDGSGHARMVNVTSKPHTVRQAVARSKVVMAAETARRLGPDAELATEIIASARAAAVLAAKRTSELIPLCHSLPVAPLIIDFHVGDSSLVITCTARTFERTGVEMEALMGCSIAALSIYSSCRPWDATMRIDDTALWEKSGGKSGDWRRQPLS